MILYIIKEDEMRIQLGESMWYLDLTLGAVEIDGCRRNLGRSKVKGDECNLRDACHYIGFSSTFLTHFIKSHPPLPCLSSILNDNNIILNDNDYNNNNDHDNKESQDHRRFHRFFTLLPMLKWHDA
jgi:hypothetical protein